MEGKKFQNQNMKNISTLLEKALRIATDTHINQVDKAGSPYIFHPIRVSNRCSTDDERIVALLHDTIEDTEVTPEYYLRKDSLVI